MASLMLCMNRGNDAENQRRCRTTTKSNLIVVSCGRFFDLHNVVAVADHGNARGCLTLSNPFGMHAHR
jgi:hypothetical protein